MVFAVRCPAGNCRKYMLVEESERGKVIPCLVCKASIRIPAIATQQSTADKPVPDKVPGPKPTDGILYPDDKP